MSSNGHMATEKGTHKDDSKCRGEGWRDGNDNKQRSTMERPEKNVRKRMCKRAKGTLLCVAIISRKVRVLKGSFGRYPLRLVVDERLGKEVKCVLIHGRTNFR